MPYVATQETTTAREANTLNALGRIAWYVFAIVETLLLFRLVLRFVGATAANGLVDFIYSVSGVLVAPFARIFGSVPVGRGALELDTLLAMFVYWLMVSILLSLMRPRNVVEPTETTIIHEQEDVGPHNNTVLRTGRRRDDYRVI